MTSANEWWLGARPRTLPAAVVPVMIGTAVAYDESMSFVAAEWLPRALLALVVSLALQVGVNYANDYSDGVRGTDDDRAGPMRLVGSQRATARAVKSAALAAFAVACVAGLVLAALTTWWLVALGVVCVVAAWTYTGGPRPYGYAGLGEVFVFVFFGLVATVGTTYVIVETVPVLAVLSGVLAGLLAVALLMVNNIRDIDGDSRSGKRTLAVRLGSARSKNLFALVYVAAFGVVVAAATQSLGALLGLAGLLAALPAISTVREATTAPQLIAALGMTARTQLVVGMCYVLGLVIQ
ncbi:MAG: 1,4-dihydroxy-2-naphthoate polyprenyltransferase [Actinobacteria bacterium]|nr:1,4-dihydroxy-2-naphthoate polyprenyltransferase [Actinomycetota bacterium]